MTFLTDLLIRTITDSIYFLGIIIVFGLLLGGLRDHTIANFQRSFGRIALMITGLIGVPIHELSHAVMALVFAHKINKVKLLQSPDENGVMGYVSHSYSQKNIYQQTGNFFIGIAPIFGGTLSIIVFMHFVIPDAYNRLIRILEESTAYSMLNKNAIGGIARSYIGLVKIIFSSRNFHNPYFYLFLFVMISISSHISLSSADIKGASKGIGAVLILFLLVNAFTTVNLMKYAVLLTGFLMIAVLFSLAAYLISLVTG